ncbi:MAG: AAA family ATPase [Nitrospiraceae bacterium]|nr:AAA family ATPase [Nitrospiraceae bacterium]
MPTLASKAPYNPILLRALVAQAPGMSQGEIARITGYSKTTVNLALSSGLFPGGDDASRAKFRAAVERYVSSSVTAMEWLAARGATLTGIWERAEKFGLTIGKQTMPVDLGALARAGHARGRAALVLADPAAIENHEEVEMLSQEALKHFRLFRSPFTGDIRDVGDIYMSDEHRYIEAAALDAARHGGFLAIVGEVGSGKSTIRKKVVAELQKDETVRIVYPRIIDKTLVTSQHIMDAIVADLSDEKPRMRHEAKARQVERILLSHSKAGCQACLMIEEAHDLTVRTLKLLKRIYEIEDGYKKCISIILIGQPELGLLFDEGSHYDMREVIRRCQVARIAGLNGNLAEYLSLKFRRAGADMNKVISADALEALGRRLMDTDTRGRKVSRAYPLTVNLYVTRAMNLAAEMGEPLVSAEVINQL